MTNAIQKLIDKTKTVLNSGQVVYTTLSEMYDLALAAEAELREIQEACSSAKPASEISWVRALNKIEQILGPAETPYDAAYRVGGCDASLTTETPLHPYKDVAQALTDLGHQAGAIAETPCADCRPDYGCFTGGSKCAASPPAASETPKAKACVLCMPIYPCWLDGAPCRHGRLADSPPAASETAFTQSFDASDWARAFVQHVTAKPSIATDEGTMIGWFANAIMRGYDEHARRAEAEAAASPPEPKGRHDIPCLFCGDPAIGVYYLDRGCTCRPLHTTQALCIHHVGKCGALGGMELLVDLTAKPEPMTVEGIRAYSGWKCKADRSGVGGNTPDDCDWPGCGCDPYADKVISALQESGVLAEPKVTPPEPGTLAERIRAIPCDEEIDPEETSPPSAEEESYRMAWRRALAAAAALAASADGATQDGQATPKDEGWVSVKDRLPFDHQGALLYSPDYPGMISVAIRDGQFWSNDNWHRNVKVDEGHYSHWLPIPSPPAEDRP